MSENKKNEKNENEFLEEMEALKNEQSDETAESGASSGSRGNYDVAVKSYVKQRRRSSSMRIVSLSITLLVIVVIIAANVGFGMLASRIRFKTDLTAAGDYTLSEDNIEVIKEIDKEVKISLCMTEAQYTGGDYAATLYKQSVMSSTMDSYVPNDYFIQTIELLKDYHNVNPKITIEFLDFSKPSAVEFVEKLEAQKISLTSGDIVMECTHTSEDGTKSTRYKALTYSDIYQLTQTEEMQQMASYGYGTIYTIGGNNLETAIANAMFTVTSEKSTNAVYFTGKGCATTYTGLDQYFQYYDYVSSTFNTLLTTGVPEDTDLLIVGEPTEDFTEVELANITKWLANDGRKGKNLLYVAKAGKQLPNITAFMKGLNVEIMDGTLVETNSDYYMTGDNSFFNIVAPETDYLGDLVQVADQDGYFMASSQTPIKIEDSDQRTTVMKTHDSAVIRPVGSADNWDPATATVKGSFASIAVIADFNYYQNEAEGISNLPVTSNVIVVSCADIVNPTTQYAQYNPYVMQTTLENTVVSNNRTVNMDVKTISEEYFVPSETSATIIRILFVVVLPVLIIAGGIIIFAVRGKL